MTRAVFVILFAVFINCFIGYRRHYDDGKLALADSLMFISPEKSLAILESMNNASDYDNQKKAEYAFLLMQARSRNKIAPENDSVIKVAIDYYSNHEDIKRRAWTYLVASDVYDMLGNDSLAIFYARDAEKLSQNIDDTRLKCFANSFLGYMLRYQLPYDESNYYLSETIRYAKELKDTLNIILPLNTLGVSSMLNDKFDEALGFFYQALSYCHTSKWDNYLPVIYVRLAATYESKKDYARALECINKSIGLIDIDNAIFDTNSLYQFKSNILAGLGMWDSIPYYAKKGLSDSSFVTQGMYDLTMMKWAEGKKDYKTAFDYSKHYAEMLDSMHKENSENYVMEMQKKYDVTQAVIERDRLYIKNQRMGLIVLGLIVICLGVSIVLLLYRRRIKELQRQREEVKSELTRYTMKMMNDRNRRLLADERRRHRLLALNDVIAKVMSTSRRDDAEQLKRHNDMALTADETAKLIEAVDVCYEGYLTKLQGEHPSLGPNDLALCCMILLKVPNRDIAILFGLSADTLKKRKLRLRIEKLGIDEVLEEWLERESRTYVDAIDAEYARPDDAPGPESDDAATESAAVTDATPGNQEA